ncbi:UTP--glucose-1-phosphate uridylyltransferase [Candidatus Parcubacteria bacterium]|nr:UTP--glucose-1-phosphate uridylyltransferase [Candidatus Parcubacteria bacterium]
MIKKAVIPIAGLGTRFLPLSKASPKELLPLVDKPVIQYIIEEVKKSGISDIVFVIRPKGKEVFNYFQKSPKLEKILKERKKENFLEEVKKLTEISKNISFSWVVQKEPLGDGHAILQAKKLLNKDPFTVLFPDDIIDSKIPCVAQIEQVFKTCQKPVIALKKMPKEKLHRYGVVKVEKIANRIYKIKKIVEKPGPDEAPSDLVVVGRYIHTPEVLQYLEKAKPGKKGEIYMSEVLETMINDGKIIYGYEFEGEWLECGNKLDWLKSNFYLSLKHPQFGPELKKYIREIA